VDQVSALMQTKSGFKPVIDPIRGFVQAIREYAGRVPENEQEFKKYLDIGGKRQTFARQYDVAPEKTISKIAGGETKTEKAFNIIDSTLGILELPSNLSEYITRFSEYKRAKALGLSDSEAMFRAAEVTVPFQLQGNLTGKPGQIWVKSIPYLNAALQVSYKFGRTAGENPARVATVGAGVLTAAFTTAIATMLMGSDEQKRYLANIPARELARAIYIPLPDGKSFMRLRIPEQFGALSGLAYLYVIGSYSGQKVRFDEFLDATTAWIPDALDLTDFVRAPAEFITRFIPQALKPSIQVAFNVKSYPEIAPLIPEYMKEEPPEYQYTAYTSEVAKTIGKAFGISPIQIEAWVRGQFGAVGGFFLGKSPANPIYRQEEDYIMGGRAYNNFYREKEQVERQYKRLEYPNSFSEEEKEEIIARRTLYENAAGVLKNLRGILKAKETLPLPLRKDAFKLLVALDNAIDTESAGEMLADLNDEIADYADEQDIQQERFYKTSPGKIEKKVVQDLRKFESEETVLESEPSMLTRDRSGSTNDLIRLLSQEEEED
ncbi:MAG: LPD38 domain-containing protein, partial [Bacteroidota bacterium]